MVAPKKLALIALITFLSSPAFAMKGFLEREEKGQGHTICYYSNGKVISVKFPKMCPISIN